jgi:hypothetical protein
MDSPSKATQRLSTTPSSNRTIMAAWFKESAWALKLEAERPARIASARKPTIKNMKDRLFMLGCGWTGQTKQQ